MDTNSICTGKISCISFAIIIALLFIAVFFNYLARFISQANQLDPSRSSTATTSVPQTPLSEHNPLYLHVVKSIPIITYEPSHCPSSTAPSTTLNTGDNKDDNSFDNEDCAICLAEFEKGDAVRVLPRCEHLFHVECIDKWLLRSLHCPICRGRMVDQQTYADFFRARALRVAQNSNLQAPSYPLVLIT